MILAVYIFTLGAVNNFCNRKKERREFVLVLSQGIIVRVKTCYIGEGGGQKSSKIALRNFGWSPHGTMSTVWETQRYKQLKLKWCHATQNFY